MGLWREQALPRLVDIALGTRAVSKLRARCLEGLRGVVVEPGFGSGLNVPHYPAEVTKVYGVDPALLGRKLARPRVEASGIEVEHVGLDGQSLPLGDDSCDGAILTFTLCTIPDHRAALAELRRVMRPGATLHFVEHGLAEDPKVQRWQHRLTPVQRRIADGCHLNRPIVADIEAAGFVMEWSEAKFVGHPKSASWFTLGRAVNPI